MTEFVRPQNAIISEGKALRCQTSMEQVHLMNEFPRIIRNLNVMGGKPCIRGMRVTVGMIAGQIGSGMTIDEMLEDFPYLEREDILEAIRYAGALASNAASKIEPEDTAFEGAVINLGEEVA